MVREDRHDRVDKTARRSTTRSSRKRAASRPRNPVLIGPAERRSVRRSWRRCSAEVGLPHNVLNAKYHQREAEIARPVRTGGAITIANKMAGRGTDHQLGVGVKRYEASREGSGQQRDQRMEIGGLHIIGSGRHESRRIDRRCAAAPAGQGRSGVLAVLYQCRARRPHATVRLRGG